jgi:hypothetical protein
VQDVAVNAGHTKVLKGAVDRLVDLSSQIGIRIVGQPMILAALIGKFRL